MELDCGIATKRIIEWLDDELALERAGADWEFPFEGGRCHVTVSPLPNRALGNVSLERTLVTIDGDQRALDEFYRLFTLRFISAGG